MEYFFPERLAHEYAQAIHSQMEEMIHYGGWSYIEVYSLPSGLRKWYYKKLADRLNKEAEAIKNANPKNK